MYEKVNIIKSRPILIGSLSLLVFLICSYHFLIRIGFNQSWLIGLTALIVFFSLAKEAKTFLLNSLSLEEYQGLIDQINDSEKALRGASEVQADSEDKETQEALYDAAGEEEAVDNTVAVDDAEAIVEIVDESSNGEKNTILPARENLKLIKIKWLWALPLRDVFKRSRGDVKPPLIYGVII